MNGRMKIFRTVHLIIFSICVLFSCIPTAASASNVSPIRIDPPITISSNGGGAEASVYFSPQDLLVTRVTASGAAYNTVQFAIAGGTDSSLFVLNPYTGQLSLFPEAKSRITNHYPYEIIVSAIDSAGSVDKQTIHAIPTQATTPMEPSNRLPCSGTHIITHTEHGEIESVDIWVIGNPISINALKLGNTVIPPEYATIWHPIQTKSLSRIHVDVPSRLSTQIGEVFTVEWKDSSEENACQYSGNVSQATGFHAGSAVLPGTTQSSMTARNQNGGTSFVPSNQEAGEDATEPTTSTSSETLHDKQCPRTSPWLWAALIVAQIIVLIVVQRNAARMDGKSGGPLSVAAVASFIVMATLWYFVDQCRSHVWFPVLGVIISCAAILTTLTQEKDSR